MVTSDRQTLIIAVLGLGEAGSVIARDLAAARTRVRGYDPAVTAAEPILDTASEAEAAREAHVVLSVNSAKAAVDAFRAALRGLRTHESPGLLWADLNTASPGVKRRLAGIAADAGVPFADVAMMAPVPGRGLRVPMLASGTGAARYAALLGPSAPISRCSTVRPGSRPARNSCAACSTRAWRPRSSRPWRRPGPRATSSGCAHTSPPN